MAVSELDLQLEFYINGVAILIVASLGILGNVLSLLLFKFRYFRGVEETLFDKIPVENGSVMGGSSPHPSGVSDGSYGNTNASCSYDL